MLNNEQTDKKGRAAASCGVRRFHKGDVIEGELVEEAARVRAEMGDEYRRVDDDNSTTTTETAPTRRGRSHSSRRSAWARGPR